MISEQHSYVVDRGYFEWLYQSVGRVLETREERSRWLLAEQLHNTVFDDRVGNDSNRTLDGIDLRLEYFRETGDDRVLDRPDPTCSVLEMLVALTRRIHFQTEGTVLERAFGDWMWVMLDNAGLKKYTDDVYLESSEDTNYEVMNIIAMVNNRAYFPSGRLGFFPLKRPKHDQRRVEIWDQMNAYLLEMDGDAF